MGTLDVLHQLWLLQEQEWALRALEDAHLRLTGILVKMLLNVPLLVEDHFTGALINELGGSVGLGGVLGSAVVGGAAGSLEGHGAECTLVENLAVSFLDVAFQQGQGQVDNSAVDAPVAHLAGIVQAILLYVGLEVGRATEGPTLRTAVGGLVCMDPLVGTETALVGKQHLAHLASQPLGFLRRPLEMCSHSHVVVYLLVTFETLDTVPDEPHGVWVERQSWRGRAGTARSEAMFGGGRGGRGCWCRGVRRGRHEHLVRRDGLHEQLRALHDKPLALVVAGVPEQTALVEEEQRLGAQCAQHLDVNAPPAVVLAQALL